MTPADDAYVNRQFVELGALCTEVGHDPDEVRELMVARPPAAGQRAVTSRV
ncbi:hypothetical protein [Embleya sp. NPDC005575]|uniref:hypothetical protein n=1 Tax=Embleya sp. NPDC005575 TaxID=3156892 RepID=UPI0033B8070F